MAKKEIGGRSSQQNDSLQPYAPTIVSSTNDGSRQYEDGLVTVVLSLPAGSQPVVNYTVTATAAGKTTRTSVSSSTTHTLNPLSSGTTYTITAVAENQYGLSPVSTTTTYVHTLPTAPSAPSASSPNPDQDIVSWTAPANGGQAISNYNWESNDGKSGTTTETSVTVGQEGSTTQAYRVRAYNSNGWGPWSPWSGNVTTTPPYFPYFPYFPWFPPYFPWFPWFPPWFPWFPWFPPWFPWFPYFPWFPPYFRAGCIGSDTEILTVNGLVAAKDVKVGDKVLTFEINEKESTTDAGTLFMWDSETLTIKNKKPVETEIVRIIEKNDSAIIYFNGNESAKYSITQPVFIKNNGEYKIRTTGSLEIGDYLITISNDGTYQEEEITDITIEEELGTVYQIDCEPIQWFIAGGYIAHNK